MTNGPAFRSCLFVSFCLVGIVHGALSKLTSSHPDATSRQTGRRAAGAPARGGRRPGTGTACPPAARRR
jgi:hypothetical protein